jgi:hypothetical protein
MTDNQHDTPDTLNELTSADIPKADDSAEAALELLEAEGEAPALPHEPEGAPASKLEVELDADDVPIEGFEPEPAPPALEPFAPVEPDVDAALSALSSLNVLAADAPREAFAPQEVILSEELPQPPLATLKRGTTPSVVPALLMIAAGVFLTFYLASGNPMPAPQHLAGGGLILFGISSLTWWLGTSRWARGSLLVGLACIAGGAALFFV